MKLKVLIKAFAIAAACFSAILPCEARTKQIKKTNRTSIVAHRGFWNCEEAGYARNSVAALKCAQDNHFWGSEFDVNMTADSVLIVFHDSFIDGKRIEDYPYSEFADFKLANGECIPTIDQYLSDNLSSCNISFFYCYTIQIYDAVAETQGRFPVRYNNHSQFLMRVRQFL